MLHWLEHVAGLDTPNGNWYLFWSGFFGNASIFGAVVLWVIHKNCHEHGCWRLSHHPHKTCRKHSDTR